MCYKIKIIVKDYMVNFMSQLMQFFMVFFCFFNAHVFFD